MPDIETTENLTANNIPFKFEYDQTTDKYGYVITEDGQEVFKPFEDGSSSGAALYIDDELQSAKLSRLDIITLNPGKSYKINNNRLIMMDTSTWTASTSLPYAFWGGSAVVLNNEIHILGGSMLNNVSYRTKHYKWNGSSWTNVSTAPYDLTSNSAVILNGQIHILGGFGTDLKDYRKHYKWNGSSWVSVSTIPYSAGNATVVLNGEIHTLGCGNFSSGYNHHYKWNGSWTNVSTLPYESPYKAVVLNGQIHILGFANHSKSHYKWTGSSWTSVSTLPYDCSGGSAVVLNNEIHILGGAYDSGNEKKHYKWDGSKWSSASTLPSNFSYCSAVVLNNTIHILGSFSGYYKHQATSATEKSIEPYLPQLITTE